MSIHIEINALGLRLGVLKGQSHPLLPDARLIDCDKSVLSVFKKHKELIAEMRAELDLIYSKLGSVSKEVEGICVPELKVVYEGQIKLLHGERGALDHTLDAVDSLLSAHALLEELEESVLAVHNEVIAFTEEKIGVENWEAIDSSIEDLLQELRVIFPDSEKGLKNFCQKHFESKQEVLQLLRTCSLDLNWKKSELLEKSLRECNATLELLFPALERLKKGKVEDRGEIQKLFASLPLELRMLVFAARNILPDDQFENTFIFDAPDRKTPDGWAEIRGLSYYDSKSERISFQKSERAEQKKTLLSKQDAARQSLNKFVDHLPEEEMRNPQLLLEAFNLLHSKKLCQMTPAVIKSLETCLASPPEDSQTTPVLKSLQAIKEQIQAYRQAKRYDGPQREQLVRALLDAAENKGGVLLSADQGVYYWVWFLAHERDPSVGGEYFGKNYAPKDLDLLITAIEKAMPPVAAPAKIVSLPVTNHVRRFSTPHERSLPPKNAQAPRPFQMTPAVVKSLASQPEDPQSTPVLKSLQEIKEQIQAYREAKRYDGPQRERLVAALLDAAESKGGVLLSADQGVYYWVWFLAHEKDPSAGGEHFGKNHAPKDLDLLIAAIDKAMPPVPVITVEKVSAPSRSSAPLPQAHVRRNSTPPEKTLIFKNVQAPKPSEVRGGPQEVKAPVMTEVKVKCLVPQGHFLSIRGEGGDLNWNRGVKLLKIDEETYVHKMEGIAGSVKYKILLDDAQFESVGDRTIEAQKSEEIVPALVMPKVAVVVNFAPADNRLFICGTGPGMSWDPSKKIELKRAEDKFVLESSVEMGDFVFKILLSDNRWSQGNDNFKAEKGKTVEISPKF